MTDNSTFYPPIEPPKNGSDDNHSVEWTRDYVEGRLVEAMLTCWRHPDRERGWQQVRSLWPDVLAEDGDYDARGGDLNSSDVVLRSAAATRRDVAEMEEAFSWVAILDARDRKILGRAITYLAKGQREISWVALLKQRGMTGTTDSLRARYERSITEICVSQSGGNPRSFASTLEIDSE